MTTRYRRPLRHYAFVMSPGSPTGLALALELHEMAIALLAQRYRREHPTATEHEVEAAVQAWLLDRPGAPDGDAAGVRRSPKA